MESDNDIGTETSPADELEEQQEVAELEDKEPAKTDEDRKEEAETHIDRLLQLVGWLRDATLQLGTADGRLHLQARVNFQQQ